MQSRSTVSHRLHAVEWEAEAQTHERHAVARANRGDHHGAELCYAKALDAYRKALAHMSQAANEEGGAK